MKNLKKNNRGFTIIEVLIVLAIAGLIMLVVFLAVPALQRNARNTSKRADVSKALGAVGELTANNNGKVPVTTDVSTPAVTTSPLAVAANLSSSTTFAAVIPLKAAGITAATAPTSSEVMIATGVVCNNSATHTIAVAPTAANFASEVTDGSTRGVVALFTFEAAGGKQVTQCQGS